MERQVITREQMRSLERYSIDMLGVPEVALMEHASIKVIRNIDLFMRETFAIFCGVGQKGALGLNIAKNLLALDKIVYIYVLGDISKASSQFKLYYKILKNIDANILHLNTIGDFEDLEENLKKVNTIVDAIADISQDSAFEGMFDFVIETINRSRIYTISVDMPSGMDANTGHVYSVSVIPDLVVCLQFKKIGLTKTSKLIATKIYVENIGIPIKAVKRVLAERPKF